MKVEGRLTPHVHLVYLEDPRSVAASAHMYRPYRHDFPFFKQHYISLIFYDLNFHT